MKKVQKINHFGFTCSCFNKFALLRISSCALIVVLSHEFSSVRSSSWNGNTSRVLIFRRILSRDWKSCILSFWSNRSLFRCSEQVSSFRSFTVRLEKVNGLKQDWFVIIYECNGNVC